MQTCVDQQKHDTEFSEQRTIPLSDTVATRSHAQAQRATAYDGLSWPTRLATTRSVPAARSSERAW